MRMSFGRGGIKSQRTGKNFELMIIEQTKYQGIKCFKHNVPTTISKGKIIYMAKGAPDFTLLFNKKSIYFDAKSFDSDRIIHSQINQHQLSELHDVHISGHLAGYLIWLRKSGIVGWLSALDLMTIEYGEHIAAKDMLVVGRSVATNMEPEINFNLLFQRAP